VAIVVVKISAKVVVDSTTGEVVVGMIVDATVTADVVISGLVTNVIVIKDAFVVAE
jgi:hypothetical protein